MREMLRDKELLPEPLVQWAVFFYDTLGAQIFLHLAWLACSLPLVTAPAAAIALNAMEWRLVANHRDHLAAGFFHELRTCFFSSFIPFIPVTALVMLSTANFYIYMRHMPLPFWILVPLGGFQVTILASVFIFFPLYIAAIPVRTCSYKKLAALILAVPVSNPRRSAAAVACFAPILFLTLLSTVGIILVLSSMAASMAVVFLSGLDNAPLNRSRGEYIEPAIRAYREF